MLKQIYVDANIKVILPEEGPLSKILLDDYKVEVEVLNLGILRKHDLKRLDFRSVFRIFFFRNRIKMLNEYDLIFINTMVILDCILACRFIKKPVYVHVREIPTGVIKILFKKILAFSRANLLFVSNATKQAFQPISNLQQAVLWNACKSVSPFPKIPNSIKEPTRFLLIGRINAWKGQFLMLQSLLHLPHEILTSLKVRIVGDVYKLENLYKVKLLNFIAEHNLEHIVEMVSFQQNPAEQYHWADAVVVPSTLPEPFGMVAIEAMSAGKAVIAANHGGLSEIVEHEITGLLFNPGDPLSLAAAIERLSLQPLETEEMGVHGIKRYETHFTEKVYLERFQSILSQ